MWVRKILGTGLSWSAVSRDFKGSRSPIRPGFSTYIMVTAALMVLAMWVFPEAGVKKGDMTRAK
jgi:hypothetical protein